MLLSVLMVTSLFAQEDMGNETKKLYNEAIKAQKSGDFLGAVKKFDEALKIEQNSELYFRKGLALKNANKLDEAVTAFHKAIEKNAKNDQAHFYLGQTLFAQKKFTEAVTSFEKTKSVTTNKKIAQVADANITKCKEQFAYPMVVEATTQLNAKEFKKAVDLFNKANETFQRADAYAGLANAYYELGENDKAIESANKSLSIEKDNPAARFYMGLAYRSKGDFAKAKELFNICLKDKTFRDRAKYELDDLKDK